MEKDVLNTQWGIACFMLVDVFARDNSIWRASLLSKIIYGKVGANLNYILKISGLARYISHVTIANKEVYTEFYDVRQD